MSLGVVTGPCFPLGSEVTITTHACETFPRGPLTRSLLRAARAVTLSRQDYTERNIFKYVFLRKQIIPLARIFHVHQMHFRFNRKTLVILIYVAELQVQRARTRARSRCVAAAKAKLRASRAHCFSSHVP